MEGGRNFGDFGGNVTVQQSEELKSKERWSDWLCFGVNKLRLYLKGRQE